MKRGPKNRAQLRQFLEQEWASVTPQELQKLYESFPKRLAEVIKGRGCVQAETWLAFQCADRNLLFK